MFRRLAGFLRWHTILIQQRLGAFNPGIAQVPEFLGRADAHLPSEEFITRGNREFHLLLGHLTATPVGDDLLKRPDDALCAFRRHRTRGVGAAGMAVVGRRGIGDVCERPGSGRGKRFCPAFIRVRAAVLDTPVNSDKYAAAPVKSFSFSGIPSRS